MNLSILYRGPLSSCNYGCTYCPFAKTKNTRAELAEDARQLDRFVQWVAARRDHTFGILFTPWGEALIRKPYQQAIRALSHLPNVRRVAIQTNLSGPTGWLRACNPEKVALWTTYHPTEVTRDRFVAQCRALDQLGIRYSVGVVGLREAFSEIEALRRELAPEVYLWVNAYKDQPEYYHAGEVEALTRIDPLFGFNAVDHASRGRACRTGETVFSVDGTGTMYRCHFIKTPIGNLYEEGFERALRPRPCTNGSCGCHIGYVHLEELHLDGVYAEGILERIPLR